MLKIIFWSQNIKKKKTRTNIKTNKNKNYVQKFIEKEKNPKVIVSACVPSFFFKTTKTDNGCVILLCFNKFLFSIL